MLELKEAVLGYRTKQKDKIVLDGLSFTLQPGELLCILGANGVGKTTMYRTILGFLPLLGGSIEAEGSDIAQMNRSELARTIAYVPQYHVPPFPYTVFDVVLMGRSAHLKQLSTPGREDERIVLEMLERMGVLALKDEIYTEISGGERQLVLIARALAQQSAYILMDEPTSNLDYGNQMRLLRTIRDLAEEGIGICFTSHYPEHAFLTNASVLALQRGKPARKGSAGEMITPRLLKDMYGMNAVIRNVEDIDGNTQRAVVVKL